MSILIARRGAIAEVIPPRLSLVQEIMADNPIAYWRGPIPQPGVVGSQLPDVIGTTPTMNLDLWNSAAPETASYPKNTPSIIPSDPSSVAMDFVPSANFWRNSPGGHFDLSAAVSFSLWAIPRSVSDATWHDIVGKFNLYGIRMEWSGGQFVWTAEIQHNTGTRAYAYSPSPIQFNQLVHLGMSYDSSDLSMYVNGALAARTFVGAPMDLSPSNFVFAQWASGNNGYDGKLAEVAMFDHSLAASRFAAHYAAGMG